jgi:hypoxanthine phosphoribosyltransferase
MRCKLCVVAIVMLIKSLAQGAISPVDPLIDKASSASFEKLISREEIEAKLEEVAKKIDRDTNGEEITLITVLKGGLLLTADLMRKVSAPCTLQYIQASSYGAHGKSRQELTITGLEKLDVAGKNVLIVDDIFDSGATLSAIIEQIQNLKPKTLRSIVLLLKNTKHVTALRPDYVLFEIENRFVVGYGLDYKEYWRGLSDIFVIQ